MGIANVKNISSAFYLILKVEITLTPKKSRVSQSELNVRDIELDLFQSICSVRTRQNKPLYHNDDADIHYYVEKVSCRPQNHLECIK